MMEPVLKWAGGKRQILKSLHSIISPKDLVGHTLYEPFVGGGSVFLSFEHSDVVINDSNKELINTYKQIKLHPQKLIGLLEKYNENHCKEFYYAVRDEERKDSFRDVSEIERAARTIYLNRTCFNGLYRVNRNGFFNVPIGSYVKPQIVRAEQIIAMSQYLRQNHIVIRLGDFEESVFDCKPGDIVYCDPPYDYDNNKDGFIRYTAERFFEDDLVRLGRMCEDLLNKGCVVIISNNDTPSVRRVFSDERFEFRNIQGRRMINNTSNKRKGVKEVIIYGKG